jgi:hypothetical protein
VYYWNRVTNETSWTLPEVGGDSVDQPALFVDDDSTVSIPAIENGTRKRKAGSTDLQSADMEHTQARSGLSV